MAKYTVYKVVKATTKSEVYDSYLSFCETSLKYAIGKLTKPTINKSLIFVFESVDSAREFISSERSYASKILECTTTCKPRPIKIRVREVSKEICSAFWGKKKNPHIEYSATPFGTLGVTSLRPVRRIY